MPCICMECVLARMGIGEKPRCEKDKKGVIACEDFIKHLCNECTHTSNCKFACTLGDKDPKDFKFITKFYPTTRNTVLIEECTLFEKAKQGPRGTPKGVKKLREAFIAAAYDSNKSSGVFNGHYI